MKHIILALLLLSLSSCGKKKKETPVEPEAKEPQVQQLPYELPEGEDLPSDIVPTLINGEVVDRAKHPEVVNIRTGSSMCTATVVGPRVVITAAHCVGNGSTSTFTVAGTNKTYKAIATISSLYRSQDHDVALLLVTEEVKDIAFASIGGVAERGKDIIIFGYGCTTPRGTGGNDGKLRMGRATITGFSRHDMVSGRGAALCFGDSGGPAFLPNAEGGKTLLGINSKGDIRTTNYNARLDSTASQSFLKNYAQQKGVIICGVNKECNENIPDPTPDSEELTKEYEFKGPDLLIPDAPSEGPVVNFFVNQEGTFMDLSLEVHIEHSYPRDLVIELVSPEGKVVHVFERVKVPGSKLQDKFGMGGKVIDLSMLDHFEVAGTWRLVIKDKAKKDTGKLISAKLSLKTLIK